MKKLALLFACVTAACGGPSASSPDATNPPPMTNDHSSSIAIDAAGATLYVVNADGDSISILDAHARTLTGEVALANRPAIAGDGTYTPSVMPRALALAPDGKT